MMSDNSVVKLHAGDQRAARLLDALEETILKHAQGMPMLTVIGICDILKDIVKGMDHHE
jgi:hypothetical protein